MENNWTANQYRLFRVLLGAYLFVHFAQLLPWAGEVFSSAGMLPDAAQSPLFGIVLFEASEHLWCLLSSFPKFFAMVVFERDIIASPEHFLLFLGKSNRLDPREAFATCSL